MYTDQEYCMYRQFSAYIYTVYSFFTAFNFPLEICLNLNSFELFICGHGAPYTSVHRAGIFKKSMGVRHRGGIGFSYRPARLHGLAEFIPWNQFRGPINI